MQDLLARLPLGALRAFEAAGRLGSIKVAADSLGVTPAAVSRQIQSLERFLGTPLFRRSNNAITLTESGKILLIDATPALSALASAAVRIRRDSLEAVVSVSVTFGTRWLVPRLARLHARHPQIALRLAMHDEDSDSDPTADLTVRYRRSKALHEMPKDLRLFDSICIPACGPALHAKIRKGGRAPAWWRQPLLSGTKDDWDWHTWARSNRVDPEILEIRHRLDTDDATIGSAIAGLGIALVDMTLALEAFEDGRLLPVPGLAGVEIGGYALDTSASSDRQAVAQFASWLRKGVAQTKKAMVRFAAERDIPIVGYVGATIR